MKAEVISISVEGGFFFFGHITSNNVIVLFQNVVGSTSESRIQSSSEVFERR